ncbi:MAG TPA: biotin carboxylase N-terminal domain-containing protein [Solirubrobacterales bacterium]|nr:biotin carboxylase N-terminal domain-containing protein [Solirubrobacterales bacterium]
MAKLQRVLIANRGEIAVRVIRACFDEGIESVLAVSDADRASLGAQLADQAVVIGPAAAAESYLVLDRVVAAAKVTGCDGLHPGYGFLSERPELSAACAEAGIAFVGPSEEAMRRSGDKATARALARELGVPINEGSDVVSDEAQAREVAERIGYPVLLKAAGGGGGRGMRRVEAAEELAGAWAQASGEAEAAFGDGRIFVERYVRHARHVEVQVLGDGEGGAIHVGHRDCTLQRRYQKLIEEAPAYGLSEALETEITEAARRMIGALDYAGAATCEFLVDPERESAGFLEINARLQVEHPVSEMVTGVDIVREQLRIAGGEGPSVGQDDVEISGHAIEVRINAESPARDFAPSPGTLVQWAAPVGTDVRVDTACFPGWTVPPHYDSLLAKLIVGGGDRSEALERTRRALRHLRVEGVETTAGFALDLLEAPDVVAGRVHTRWVEEEFMQNWLAAAAAGSSGGAASAAEES